MGVTVIVDEAAIEIKGTEARDDAGARVVLQVGLDLRSESIVTGVAAEHFLAAAQLSAKQSGLAGALPLCPGD